MLQQLHSHDNILKQLRALGVASGDSLMLHASLRKIGRVEGGVQGLIQVLKESVGPEGLLLMVLGAELDWFLVNENPTQSAAELAQLYRPFDHLNSPAMEEVGYLAEAFRQSHGVLVTNHPDGRYAAWGAQAKSLFLDTPWDHYYGPDSVLERFCRLGGRILRMGADPGTVNALHLSEYLADITTKRERTITFLVQGENGPEFRKVTSLDNQYGIVEWPGVDYFELILESYIQQGFGQHGRVGNAKSELFNAHHLVKFGTAWMEEHLPSPAHPP